MCSVAASVNTFRSSRHLANLQQTGEIEKTKTDKHVNIATGDKNFVTATNRQNFSRTPLFGHNVFSIKRGLPFDRFTSRKISALICEERCLCLNNGVLGKFHLFVAVIMPGSHLQRDGHFSEVIR